MNQDKKYMMIACQNIQDEITDTMRNAGLDYPVVYLAAGTHDTPDKMRATLQTMIDSLTGIDYLILPMGRCGNATIGLKSDRFSLVLPKCEDCINLVLSEDSLKVNRPKGTFFFTDGWLRSSMSARKEYDRTVKKYGKEQADLVMNMIYGGYQHFALLNTGLYDLDRAKEQLDPLAQVVSVDFTEIPSRYGVLKKMVELDLENENFVIVPPGVTVNEDMLENTADFIRRS